MGVGDAVHTPVVGIVIASAWIAITESVSAGLIARSAVERAVIFLVVVLIAHTISVNVAMGVWYTLFADTYVFGDAFNSVQRSAASVTCWVTWSHIVATVWASPPFVTQTSVGILFKS